MKTRTEIRHTQRKVRNPRSKVLLSVIIVVYWFSQYMYMPFLTPHLLTLGYTAAVTGVIVGAYGLTQLLFRFPIGVYADYSQGHVRIMRMGILLSICSSIGFYLFRTPQCLFMANFAQGLSSSTWLSFVVLYSSLFGAEEYQKAMGICNGLNQGGIVLSYFIGGLLVDKIVIYNVFAISAGFAGAALLLSFGIKRITTEGAEANENRQRVYWKNIFCEKTIVYSLGGLTIMFTAFATAFSFTTTMAKSLGATGTEMALVSIAFTLSAAVGSFAVSNKRIKSMTPQRVLGICFVMMSLACIGIGLVQSISALIVMQVLEGISVYLLFSYVMGKATEDVSQENKSTAMGLFQTIYSAGIFLGPIFFGALVQMTTLRMAFIITAIIPGLGIGLSIIYFHIKNRKGDIQV